MHPGDIPLYPSMPTMPPLPVSMPLPRTMLVSDPGHTLTGKRRREDDLIVPNLEPADVSAPKRQKAHDVLFRIIVPSKQIGKVIGKVGCRIQKVREDTKATIKIADAVAVCFPVCFFTASG